MSNDMEPAVLESASPAEPRTRETHPLDQAYNEFCNRRAEGETLDPDAYCAKFPQFQSSLARLLHAHLFLEENFASKPEIHWPEAGETFLDFHLILELGRGAFARVFLATEPRLGNRLVAVKISQHGGAEAEVLGRMQHPHIVPVYSAQEDPVSGLTAVCMPYLGSATLCDVLDQANLAARPEARARIILDAAAQVKYPLDPSSRRPGPERLLRNGSYLDGVRTLGAKLADALAFIHDRGICHRDLKPSNVLLSPEAEPMLLDFNLCTDDSEPLDRLGGTMPYMSPEQLRAVESPADINGRRSLDARSDIYALGVILYQLVTGRHPFGPLKLTMSTAELRNYLVKKQQERVVPAREINPNVDAGLSRLIQRCLAPNANERPQTAAEVAHALRTELAPAGRAKRWIGRNPGKVLTAVAVLFMLAATSFALSVTRAPFSDRRLDSGTRLYQEGRFAEAADHFSEALRTDPENARLLFARGLAYQNMNEYNLAVRDFEQSQQRAPDGVNLACIGFCLNRMQQPLDAEAWHQRAIDAGFGSAEVYNNLAFSQLQLNKTAAAKSSLDRAIEINPGLQAAYHNRALAALRSVPNVSALRPEMKESEAAQRLEAAIKDVRKAAECGPGSSELSFDTARLYAALALIDRVHRAAAVEALVSAMNQGGDPQRLQDVFFRHLRDEAGFQKLPRDAQTPPAQPSRRLVDPVRNRT